MTTTGTQKAIAAGRVIDVILADWMREAQRQQNMARASLAASTASSSAARDLERIVEFDSALMALIEDHMEKWSPLRQVPQSAREPATALVPT
jgi:hypothetical protein